MSYILLVHGSVYFRPGLKTTKYSKDGEEMTKHSHRYGVGSAIFFVLAFGRASSRDIVSGPHLLLFKFLFGSGGESLPDEKYFCFNNILLDRK